MLKVTVPLNRSEDRSEHSLGILWIFWAGRLWPSIAPEHPAASAASAAHLGSDLVPLEPYTSPVQPDDKATHGQTVSWKPKRIGPDGS